MQTADAEGVDRVSEGVQEKHVKAENTSVAARAGSLLVVFNERGTARGRNTLGPGYWPVEGTTGLADRLTG
jgi:hypothetical protein